MIVLSVILLAGLPTPDQFSVEPKVTTLIERIVAGNQLDTAIEELGKLDRAAPYIRMVPEPSGQQRDYRRDLKKALAIIENRSRERNLARCKAWGEAGRFDLCADFLSTIQSDDEACKIADLTLAFRQRAFDYWTERSKTNYPFGPSFKELNRPPLVLIEDEVRVQLTAQSGRSVLVVARDCVAKDFLKFHWFVAAGSSLKESLPEASGNGVWESCFLIVNSSSGFTRLRSSFVVCDGDVELVPGVECSIIIANGNISSKTGGGGDFSLLAATGDITLPLRKVVGKNVFHAGGKVALDGKPVSPSSDVKVKQSGLPFGIRFVQTEEFGLEMAMGSSGLRFDSVAKESPFAEAGVEAGDVLTKIDDVTPKSLADFRRALRRGVIRESVILRIKRNGKDITRIVFLDGIPLPVTPPPRAK